MLRLAERELDALIAVEDRPMLQATVGFEVEIVAIAEERLLASKLVAMLWRRTWRQTARGR